MGRVVAGRRQHDLRVRRHLDLARFAAEVRERHAPDLGVVLGRDEHLEPGQQIAVAALDLGAVLEERHLVAVGLAPRGLEAGGPHLAAPCVAQEDERAPGIPRRVFAPPCYGEWPAVAVAGTGRRQHHDVAPVGEQVRARYRIGRRREPARRRRHHRARLLVCRRFLRPGTHHGHVARCALLQYEVGGLHHRLGVESLAHPTVEEHVGQGDDRHPLVVRHVGADHRHLRAFGQALAGVIERFVEAVGPEAAGPRELAEVAGRRRGIDHRGQRRRVGRDHQIVTEPALEAEPGHAEARVLVGEVEIAHVVSGFRDAPGHAAPLPVGDLTLHGQTARLLQQAAVRLPHDEPGHQILEHRARPRDQRDVRLDRRHRAREPEPVHGRHVTAGDRDEAREPGLRGEKIVTALVERSVGDPVADGEELTGPVEQEFEIHSVEEITGAALDLLETFQQALGGSRRALERLDGRRGATPVDEAARLARRLLRPLGDLARRRAGEIRQVAEQGRSVEQSRDRARTQAVGRQGAAKVVEPLDPRRECVEITAMGRDRRLRDLRPHDRFGSRVGGERLCPVAESPNRGRDLAKSTRPRGGRGRLLGQRAAQLVDRRARLGGQRVAQQEERGVDSALDLDPDDRAAGALVCRDGEDTQMPGEIPAIDGGDVSRLQGLERARVVPVVEVPAVALEIGDGRQGRLEPIDRVERADPAEIARGHRREQIDAHIGR